MARIKNNSYAVGQEYGYRSVQNLARELNRESYYNGTLKYNIGIYHSYKVILIAVSKLARGLVSINPEKVEIYAQLPADSMPPIILAEECDGEFLVLDGNHRIESSLCRNETEIKALIPISLANRINL